jgi:hypothetical protein
MYLIEESGASRVLVGVPPTTEGEQNDMNVGDWEEGNKASLHMVEDTEFHHN